MEGDVSLKISPEVVKPIIEAKIESAIISALTDGKAEMINGVVGRMLELKVNKDGKVGNYSSDNKYTFIEALCMKAIREAAQRAIVQWVEKNEPAIQSAIEQQFAKKRGGMAKAFIDGLTESIKSSWRFGVDVNFNTLKDD